MGLEIVELMMRLEEEFNLEIPNEDAAKLTTIGEIDVYIAGRLGVEPSERDALFERLQAIIVVELAIPTNKIRREARLVEDLGLD